MKKHFVRAAFLLALAGAAPLASCTHAEQQEASADANTAYNDFKADVERAEANVQRLDFSDTDFSRELDSAQAGYDRRLAAVERDMDQYTAEQKAEVEKLKARYTTAVEQRRTAYTTQHANGATTTTTTTEVTVGAPKIYVPVNTYANIPASQLRATYEAFNQTIKANEGKYEIADWRAINADWKALNARKDEVDSQLSRADKDAIADEKIKYAAYKSYDKAEARASEVGHAIGDAANKAGNAIDKAANKVGDAAKGAYKGARDAVKKDDNRD